MRSRQKENLNCVLKNVPSQEQCKYNNIYPPPHIISDINSVTFVGFLQTLKEDGHFGIRQLQ